MNFSCVALFVPWWTVWVTLQGLLPCLCIVCIDAIRACIGLVLVFPFQSESPKLWAHVFLVHYCRILALAQLMLVIFSALDWAVPLSQGRLPLVVWTWNPGSPLALWVRISRRCHTSAPLRLFYGVVDVRDVDVSGNERVHPKLGVRTRASILVQLCKRFWTLRPFNGLDCQC